MSKVSAMQAMREARFNARAVRAASAGVAARATVAPVDADAAEIESPADVAAPMAEPEAQTIPEQQVDSAALCGHRSMNNRTCRRPAGHPEKNHRYS